jgi:hypothetical protein
MTPPVTTASRTEPVIVAIAPASTLPSGSPVE